MIKIGKNDTLIDIIEKIQNVEWDDIILQFPLGHSILHNYLSLKIIKSKAGKKKLTIITSDLLSRKIWKRLWIKYTIIKDSDYIEKKNAQTQHDTLMKHNFSFLEYLQFELKKYYSNLLQIIKRNKNLNEIRKYSQKYKSYSNTWIFVWLFFLSLVLFIFIFYFAVNKTTVRITPEVVVQKKAKNFVFTENLENELVDDYNNVKISTISDQVSLTETYTTSGVNEETLKRWHGKIRIYNNLTEPLKLLPETRFLTDDEKILFEIRKWVTVPGSITDNFWTLTPGAIEAEVFAKSYDLNGKFTWERGNIPKDTTFTLPWLRDDGANVYAISIEDFSGWSEEYDTVISEADMENTKLIFEQKMKNKLNDVLKERIKEMNIADKTFIDILSIDDVIEYYDKDISVENWAKAWDTWKNITLHWTIKWKTYTYNREELVNKLKTVVWESILEWVESILLIDDNSLRISSVIYKKEEPFQVKATVEIDALIAHDFWNKENAYIEKLKSTIRGMPKQEAIKLLINDPRISNVTISIRPFFIKNISNIPENIEFEVEWI